MKQRIQLNEHFTYGKLLRFALPSIIMMIFTSVYGVVDGLFVSNYVGKTAFASVNLIMPFIICTGAIGFMLGTGGSAIVGKTLGEGDREKANRYFSMLVYATIALGVLIAILGLVAVKPVARLFGAEGELLDGCVTYGSILLAFQPFFMLQSAFQSFFATAEKTSVGLWVIVGAGLTNIWLDFVFVGILHWGIWGAALATGISEVVGGVTPVVYFSVKNGSLLRLTKTRFYRKIFLKVCGNGSSEFLTNISSAVVGMLYNFQLMKLAGEDGISAYGVIMYVNFVFLAIFFGFSIASAPVFSYHFGADNKAELKSLFRKSMTIVVIFGVVLAGASQLLTVPLSKLFVGDYQGLYEMTVRGMRLFAISFLVQGINIFGSAFFTALNDGLVSAVLSFGRTLVFQVSAVFLLPLLLGLDGIWLAVVAAELLALVVTVVFFAAKRKKYGYA